MPWTPPEHPKPVVAKFYVAAVELASWATQIKMQVVTRGDDNKAWSAATPSGNIAMNVANAVAAEQFWPGQEWLVTFTPVPADAVGKEGMEVTPGE